MINLVNLIIEIEKNLFESLGENINKSTIIRLDYTNMPNSIKF